MTSPSFNAARIGRAWGTPLSYRARYLSPASVLKQVKPWHMNQVNLFSYFTFSASYAQRLAGSSIS